MHQWHSRRRKLVLYVEWRLRQSGFDPDARDPAAQESLKGILDELDARKTGSLYRLCQELGRGLPAEEKVLPVRGRESGGGRR